MKILVISTNFSPELVATGKYTGEMVEWLANNGAEVRVVCAPPYYPEWKVGGNYSAWKYVKEFKNNFTIYRCPLWVPRKPSGIKRLLHLASFALSSFPVIILQAIWKPDIVICIEPPLFNSLAAIVCSKLSGAKSVLHIQDFEVDAAFGLGIIKLNWLKRFIYYIEHILMQSFDRVSTISATMLEKLSKKGIPKERLFFFPNWIDTSFITPLCSSKYRQTLSLSDNVVVLYSGSMGEKQGLEIIIAAAKRFENTKVYFVMCGSGSAMARLKQRANDIQLKNITWLPLQPLDSLNELLNLADIHLLPQQAGAEDLVMPSKLAGMLSSGGCIVATAQVGTEVEKVVKHCGLVVQPGDTDAFYSAIKELSEDKSLRDVFGRQSRLYAEEYLQQVHIMCNLKQELTNLMEEKKV